MLEAREYYGYGNNGTECIRQKAARIMEIIIMPKARSTTTKQGKDLDHYPSTQKEELQRKAEHDNAET